MKKLVLGAMLVLGLYGIVQGQGMSLLVSENEKLKSNHWTIGSTYGSGDTMYLDSLHTTSVLLGATKEDTTVWYPWSRQGGYGYLWFSSTAAGDSVVNMHIRKQYSANKINVYNPPDSNVVSSYTTESVPGKFIYFNSSISGETSTTMPTMGYFRFRFVAYGSNSRNARINAVLGYGQ